MEAPCRMPASSYVGSELEIFQHATRWKAYFARALRPYVTGSVLEVGAGLGATSRFLCDGKQRSWTCLEPDPALLDRLQASFGADPLPSPVRALCGTVGALPDHERFDTILYVDVLEHIEDDSGEIAGGSARLPRAEHARPGPAYKPCTARSTGRSGTSAAIARRRCLRPLRPVLRPVEACCLDAVGMAASLANRMLLRASMPTVDQIRFWDRVLVPVSRVIDPVLARTVGKSVVAVWTCSVSDVPARCT